MNINVTLPTAALEGNDTIQAKAIAKVFANIDWGNEDFSHGEVQWLLNNATNVEGLDLYSPVRTEAQMSGGVPANWPGNTIEPLITPEVPATYDPETGEELTPYEPPVYGPERTKTYFEYCHVTEVTGGYVCKFQGSAADADKNIARPTWNQQKVQEAHYGGFLTQEEVDAIKVTTEP